MCGIFGGIGKVNPGIIRALTLANRERGTDSLGFFNSAGKILKRAGDPLDILTDRDFQRYIDRAPRAGGLLRGILGKQRKARYALATRTLSSTGASLGPIMGLLTRP